MGFAAVPAWRVGGKSGGVSDWTTDHGVPVDGFASGASPEWLSANSKWL